MSDYTIICTHHTYGSVTEVVKKKEVRSECERLKKVFSKPIANENCYTRIEVVNNQTGEIREFWNNKENLKKF